jgi:hypothetical protein
VVPSACLTLPYPMADSTIIFPYLLKLCSNMRPLKVFIFQNNIIKVLP